MITHEFLNSHKIGITNEGAKEKRLENHTKEGWEVYRTHYFVDGKSAFEVEQEVLSWWRSELGLQIYLSASEMPQGGFTETVDASEIDIYTIWNHVEDLIKISMSRNSQVPRRKTSMPKKTKGIKKH